MLVTWAKWVEDIFKTEQIKVHYGHVCEWVKWVEDIFKYEKP